MSVSYTENQISVIELKEWFDSNPILIEALEQETIDRWSKALGKAITHMGAFEVILDLLQKGHTLDFIPANFRDKGNEFITVELDLDAESSRPKLVQSIYEIRDIAAQQQEGKR